MPEDYEEIIVEIPPTGVDIKISTPRVRGKRCLDVSKFLDDLGVKKGTTLTQGYYQEEDVRIKRRIRTLG